MIRCRPPLTIRPTPTNQTKVIQTSRAIAQRPLRNLREQARKLILAHHTVRTDHLKDTKIERGNRRAARMNR
jgi:predicted metallo-beta-lactamase superfamily hydrolase